LGDEEAAHHRHAAAEQLTPSDAFRASEDQLRAWFGFGFGFGFGLGLGLGSGLGLELGLGLGLGFGFGVGVRV